MRLPGRPLTNKPTHTPTSNVADIRTYQLQHLVVATAPCRCSTTGSAPPAPVDSNSTLATSSTTGSSTAPGEEGEGEEGLQQLHDRAGLAVTTAGEQPRSLAQHQHLVMAITLGNGTLVHQ